MSIASASQTPGPDRTVNQKTLQNHIDQFTAGTKYGQGLHDLLRRSDCPIWRCVKDDYQGSPRWWLNITLPARVAEMFDVHLEVQVLYVEYPVIEPRLLSVLQSRIRRDVRVDPGLAIVAGIDSNFGQLVSRRRGEFAIVDIRLDKLDEDKRDLRVRMAEVLTSVDHFDITIPVREPSGFFGRRSEFDNLMQALDHGQSVGLFGLRKAGKTSLMYYVKAIREEAGRPVVWVDISGISSADEFRRNLIDQSFATYLRVSDAMEADGQQRPKRPNLRTTLKNGGPKGTIEDLRLYWVQDLSAISSSLGLRLEVFIDEVDQAYPVRSQLGAEEAAKLLVAITQLRGLIQSESPETGGMVILCAGVDPSIFERPLLPTGSDNLLYKLVRLVFLAPMSRDEMANMVRDLGRRMGVKFSSHQVVDLLFQEYGGHPLLTRKACSISLKDRPLDPIPWHPTVESVEKAIRVEGDGSPAQQAYDILTSFHAWFPDEAELLRLLWSTDPDDQELARSVIADNPKATLHGESYGLCNAERAPRIRAMLRLLK